MAEMYRIDCNWKTYRFADFPPAWVSGSFSEPKIGSERDARNAQDCNCKTYRFVDFLTILGFRNLFGANNRIREECRKCRKDF